MALGFTFFGLFSSPEIFLTLMILFGGLIGAASGKLTISAFAGFLIYSYIALDANLVFFTNLLYLIIILILVILGFNVWNYLGGTEA